MASTEGSHWVVVYLDHRHRRFSITARTATSRLVEVNQQMEAAGYEVRDLARLAKAAAATFKDAVMAAYVAVGYEYQARPALS